MQPRIIAEVFDDIKKTLWATADKLRANIDAAEYKYVVLGLIFVKYISDTFAARRAEVASRLADPKDEYSFEGATPAALALEMEDRDYYKSVNVLWGARSRTVGGVARSGRAARHWQTH